MALRPARSRSAIESGSNASGRPITVLNDQLASSPEAWINVANEVMGDPFLRERLQIWQVVYPTRMPLLVSLARIDKVLRSASPISIPMARRLPATTPYWSDTAWAA